MAVQRIKENLHNLKVVLKDHLVGARKLAALKKTRDVSDLNIARVSSDHWSFEQFIELQTPGASGIVGNTLFISSLKRDFDIVVNKPNPSLKLSNDTSKNWLMHIEPPSYIQRLGLGDPKVTEKFGRVYTTDPALFEQGGKFIASPPYVHWHLATDSYTRNKQTVFNLDYISDPANVITKRVNLSAINSNMNLLPGHQLRNRFISDVCEEGIDFNLYGGNSWAKYKQYLGRTPQGKWPVYGESRYVLAIENEVAPYYWTEKFTDAIMCYAMPIYYGTDDIKKYFPEGCYLPLDITKRSAVSDLNDMIHSDYFEKNYSKILEARELIINHHNLFSFIDREIQKTRL